MGFVKNCFEAMNNLQIQDSINLVQYQRRVRREGSLKTRVQLEEKRSENFSSERLGKVGQVDQIKTVSNAL